MKAGHLGGLILAALLCLIVYFPGLPGPLLLDDGPQLTPIMNTITAENWRTAGKEYLVSNSGQLGRAIPMATFIVNAALSGADTFWWKLTNVLIHCLNGALVFLFVRLLIRARGNTTTDTPALLIATLWLLHPLHIGAVLYLVQRMALLTTTFTLLSLVFYLGSYSPKNSNSRTYAYLGLSSLLLFPLAMLCKENAAVYPLYILALHAYLRYPALAGNGEAMTFRPAHKQFSIVMGLSLLAGSIVLLAGWQTLVANAYAFREFTISERLLTESRVLVMYLAQIFLPIPSALGFFYDDIEISKGFLTPASTAVSMAILCAIAGAAIVLRKKVPLLTLGITIFFVSHLIESTVFPLELAFEHRNYLAILGIILAVTSPFLAGQSNPSYQKGLIAILIVLSSLTAYRAYLWGDSNRLFPHFLATRPHSPRILIIYADTYAKAGQHETALQYLSNLTGLGVELHRISILCSTGAQYLDAKIASIPLENQKISNYELEGIMTISNQILDKACAMDAASFAVFIDKTLSLPYVNKVARQKVLLYRGHLLHMTGNTSSANEALRRSFDEDSSNPIPLFLLVQWLTEQGNHKEAESVFEQAKAVSAKSTQDYSDFLAEAQKQIQK